MSEERINELSPLQRAALAVKELRARLDASEAAAREPIAIVGMGCRFPQADGLEAYWRLLSEGRDAIREVPPERWDLERYFDANPNAPGKINTRYGGFLDGVDGFDAAFFGISPSEAERLDPQQRLLLEVAWHALEDAGQDPAALRGSRTGVFVGITQMDYGVMQLGGAAEDIQAYTGTGNGLCFAAGRLAYVLGLQGPAFSVDTACSSSMVALHQACQALRNRECDAALVAGAQLNLTPPMQIFLSKTQSFAPDGRCRTFDESANGFVLGEGVGVLVLRRLSDALSRRDSVRALIRASGVNHDGPASGLTVPSEAAQEALLREVYQRARLNPGDIDYVEAHGTATALGDPIEVGALRSVFGLRAPEEALLLGSVKTNFGHLNAAAGIAGLIKVALMLEHRQVAPNLHFQRASSRVPWDGLTVRVPTELLPWPSRQRPRRAGVSSFGLSGTNTHTVLEEAPAPALSAAGQGAERPLHVLCLSARSAAALRQLATAYADSAALRDAASGSASVADICFSAHTGRRHFSHRLALRVGSVGELRRRLGAYAGGEVEGECEGGGGGSWSGQVPKGGPGRLAWLFADDAPLAAVSALAGTEPRVAAALARCQAARLSCGAVLSSAQAARAAIFAAQYALADLWRAWGLRPAAVAGCGVGELAALCVAGVLDPEQAHRALAGQAVAGRVPEISVYSGADGRALPFAPIPDYCLRPSSVPLSAATQVLQDAGFENLLGIGGQPAGGGAIVLTEEQGSLWPALLEALARLYLRGLAVDWQGFDAGFERQRLRLPGYPFQRQRFWLPAAKPVKPPALAAAAAIPAAVATASAELSATAVAQGLPDLLGSQLESAAAAIAAAVAQQLDVLRGRMAGRRQAAASTAAADDAQKFLPDALGDWQLLLMAADSEAALDRLGEDLAHRAAAPSGIVGAGPVRRMLVHRGGEDAAQALGRGGSPDAKRLISATARAGRSAVFMFPGVGDHYLRMAQGLYAGAAVFRQTLDDCCERLKSPLGVDLREVLYPLQAQPAAPPSASAKPDLRAMLGRGKTAADPAEIRLNQTVHSQPLLFIVEVALGRLWQSMGVEPRAMIGYSIGEYAAACLAGVIAVEDALLLITRRAQMIQELPTGVMLALPLAEHRVLPLLGEELSLAIVSTPGMCVVGGTEAAIVGLEERLRNDSIVSRRLPGTHAFHSRMLAPLHASLVELVSGFTLKPPRIPYVSNLSGDWITDAQATDPQYWARHTWQTVRFADGLGRLLETEGRIFLELGPGQSLGSFVLQHPAAQKLQDKIVLPSLRNRYEQQADEAYFLGTLGKLWLSGFEFGKSGEGI